MGRGNGAGRVWVPVQARRLAPGHLRQIPSVGTRSRPGGKGRKPANRDLSPRCLRSQRRDLSAFSPGLGVGTDETGVLASLRRSGRFPWPILAVIGPGIAGTRRFSAVPDSLARRVRGGRTGKRGTEPAPPLVDLVDLVKMIRRQPGRAKGLKPLRPKPSAVAASSSSSVARSSATASAAGSRSCEITLR